MDIKDIQRKKYLFGNENLWPFDVYNGPSQVYCFKPEEKTHKCIKGFKCQWLLIIPTLFRTRDLFNISYSRELYLYSKSLHFEEIVRVKMAVCFEMIVSET